jgi:hypothetical protein
MIKPLPIEDYRAVYEPGKVNCQTTETMQPTEEIIGQERAQKALRFGLEIQERGFNIYVAGMPGSGRRTAVRNFLDELAKTKTRADDWVYEYGYWKTKSGYDYAVFILETASRPSISIAISLILYFWIFPDTVMGTESTKV